MDNDCSGAGLGLPLMVALVGGLLDRNTRGSIVVMGSLNLGGSV
jgi:ATP-dependent Lon protease